MATFAASGFAPRPAWSYGLFFGAPQSHWRGARSRRRPALPPTVPLADVPLPIPRPRFPSDPVAVETPSTPVIETPQAPVAPTEPAPVETGGTAKDATLPLPPERPAELKSLPAPAAAPDKTAPAAPQPSVGNASPSKPVEPSKPGIAPSGAKLGEAPGQPVDDATCPSRLKMRNVSVETVSIGPQPDVRCTVVQAVRLTALTLPDGGKVDFPDRPTIACTTADAFSLYVRDLLSPLAKGTYGAAVTSVWTGPGLECRSRDHILGAKLSAHGQGLAVDIAQLKLGNGRMIEVGQPKTDADQGFETASRAAGCGYFHTVLGPGSDSYHRTHWHFDLEVRGAKGDSKYCK